MKIEKISVTPITELNFNETLNNSVELIPVSSDVDIDNCGDILRRHHALIRAGIGEYKIYGLIVDFIFLSDKKKDDIHPTMIGFLTSIFGERNVLSLKYVINEDKQIYKILLYPLTLRTLTPEKWCDVYNEGKGFKINSEVLNQLKSYFFNALNEEISFAEEIGFKDSSAVKVASIDLIKDMKIEEPDPLDYEEKVYDAYGFQRQEEHDMSLAAYRELTRNAITYFTTGVERSIYLKYQNGQISQKAYLEEVKKFLIRMRPDITEKDMNAILSEVATAIFGNYILEPLLNAKDISDIKVLSPKNIRVKCNGKRMTSNVTFYDEDDYYRFFNSLATKYGFSWDGHPIVLRTDRESNKDFILRINITTPLINSSKYPYLHIRKIRKKKMSMEELITLNCLPRHVADYLIDKINSSSMVFCGKGGSGKTTFMNTLIDFISYGCSGACYQESEELFSYNHPDFMWQHYVPAGNGYQGYSLQEEARNGLRTDLDYLIIGEITGGEARDFLTAISTGHRGMCSVHSHDTKSATDRLAEYIMRESSDYSKAQALYMLKEIGCIVYMEKFKVKEISEIVGFDEEKQELIFKVVYKL